MKRRDFVTTGLALTAITRCAGKQHIPSRSSGMGSRVFEPIKIGNITIPNRIVFPPITTNYSDNEGFVTQRLIDFHKHVAEGGAGLSIVGASPVRKDGGGSLFVMLDDDIYIDGLKNLFTTIKRNGSIACIQLFHGERNATNELSKTEIGELVTCFAESAYRAKTAGADMVELHGAHGYLLCRFLSPNSNKRKDEYGGSTENRTRFIREIVLEIRSRVGNEYPICCRISADEYVEGGLTLEESKVIARILVDSGVDAISVSAGISPDIWLPTKEMGRRCYAHLSRGIKETVDVPVICVGNILDLTDAEKVIQDSDADLAAMGRALIADPYLVVKTIEGKTNEINGCIQCRKCLSTVVNGMSCSVNRNL